MEGVHVPTHPLVCPLAAHPRVVVFGLAGRRAPGAALVQVPRARLYLGVPQQPLFRRIQQPPEDVVGWMDIQPGMQVLELGPGPGTFTVEAARRAGPQGVVHAVDIQADMLERLQTTLDKAGVSNVSMHLSSAYALPVPDASIDRLFMVAVLAEIPDNREPWPSSGGC